MKRATAVGHIGATTLLALTAVALGARTVSAADRPCRLQGFVSAGPSAMDGTNRLSVGAGMAWSFSDSLSLLGEVQHGRHQHGIRTLSGSLGMRWRMAGSSRLSPYALTGAGVVDYDSPFYGRSLGRVLSLGGGLDYRLNTRTSVFVESRINLWTGPRIGDGLDGHLPVRAGVALSF